MVEKWWQDSYVRWLQEQQQRQQQEKQNYGLNVVCPHPGSILNRHTFEQHRNQISHNHSITMDAAACVFADCASVSSKPAGLSPFTSSFSSEVVTPPPRILVVEPDPDLQQVYVIWLSSMGFNAIVTDSGQKCLVEVLKATCGGEGKNKNKNEGFDLIILDTHLNDIPCLQVAKKIIAGKADQKIIFTSTMPSTFVKKDIVNPIGGISNTQILIKPFQLSDLLPLLDKGNKASNI
jgi:CheY-like chemotaxis protein